MRDTFPVFVFIAIAPVFARQESYRFGTKQLQGCQVSNVTSKTVPSRAKCAFLCRNSGKSCAFFEFEDGNCTMSEIQEFMNLGEIATIDIESRKEVFISQFQGMVWVPLPKH